MSQETFHILQWLNGSSTGVSRINASTEADSSASNLLLGIDTANGVQPAYLYNAKTTLLAPINEAELVGTSEGWVTTNDKSYYHIRLQYRQNIHTTRPGALYGEYGLPPTLNDTNDLLSGSRSNASIDSSHMWISYGGVRGGDDEETNNGRVLNFVDPVPSSQELITYEFVFGPRNTEPPSFSEAEVSLKVPSPASDVRPGTVLGTVTATDPDGGNITYGLYGGDGYFVINPKTGEVKVARTPLPSDITRSCLTAKATDDGYPPKSTFVPVEVDIYEGLELTTPPPCGLLSNLDLQPNYVEKGVGETTTAAPFGTGDEFVSVTHRLTTVPISRSSAHAPSATGHAVQATTESEEVQATAVRVTGRPSTSAAGSVAATTSSGETEEGEETEAVAGSAAVTTAAAGDDYEGEGETEHNQESTRSVAGGITSAAVSRTTAAAARSQTTTTGRTGVSAATGTGSQNSSGTPATGIATTSVLTAHSEPGSSVSGQSAILVTSAGSSAGSTESPSGSAAASIGSTASASDSSLSSAGTAASATLSISSAGGSQSPSGSGLTTSTIGGSVSVSSGSIELSASTSLTNGADRSGSTGSLGSVTSQTLSQASATLSTSSTGGRISAAVSVAQNEDDLIPTLPGNGGGTTTAGPIQNSALPAQAITPAFLPPDLLQGLGNEVNVTSLTTDDLVMLACKLRGSQPIKPIWGIICDLGKAGGGGTTRSPSGTAKRLLDQIG